jgi:hypothetical protein
LAGVIGVTRQEKSNVIPGVAIATALMPPVCTAGYGVANGEWGFVAGALYLYSINCVFIALATIIGIRVLKLQRRGFSDEAVEKRVKLSLLALVLCTTLPSAYLAFRLVQAEYFKSRAQGFVSREFAFDDTHVAETVINADKRVIEISLIGNPLSAQQLKNVENRLALADLGGTRIIVHQAGDNTLDVTALRSSLLSDLYRDSQQALREKDVQLQQLQQQLVSRDAIFSTAGDIVDELRAQHPDVTRVFVSEGVAFQADSSQRRMLQLVVEASRVLSADEQSRIGNWFRVRTRSNDVMMRYEVTESADSARQQRP